jgi:hypothetical protein
MKCWRCHSNSVNTGSRLPRRSDVKTRKRRHMVGIDMIRNNTYCFVWLCCFTYSDVQHFVLLCVFMLLVPTWINEEHAEYLITSRHFLTFTSTWFVCLFVITLFLVWPMSLNCPFFIALFVSLTFIFLSELD